MKKLWLILWVTLCLTGCGQVRVFETVNDSYIQPQTAAKTVSVTLPKDAAAPVSVNGSGERLYICDGYSIMLQTLSGGDLDRTLRCVTGYSREGLTVMSQQQDGLDRYDCVWSCAGEGGDQVCRAAVLDDGSYHYVLSVMADSGDSGALEKTWQTLFQSFQVSTD